VAADDLPTIGSALAELIVASQSKCRIGALTAATGEEDLGEAGREPALDQTIAQVKAISTELRPAVLDKFGLAAAIEWQCREFEKRTSIVCDCRLPAEDLNPGPECSIALFRILQESLTNVARHSGATQATVNLRAEESEVVLTVGDDGRGISTAEISAPDSLGLLGMRERTDSLGGQFTVQGRPGHTFVEVRIPLTKSESNTVK
jgi:signal transduction histidine kinase